MALGGPGGRVALAWATCRPARLGTRSFPAGWEEPPWSRMSQGSSCFFQSGSLRVSVAGSADAASGDGQGRQVEWAGRMDRAPHPAPRGRRAGQVSVCLGWARGPHQPPPDLRAPQQPRRGALAQHPVPGRVQGSLAPLPPPAPYPYFCPHFPLCAPAGGFPCPLLPPPCGLGDFQRVTSPGFPGAGKGLPWGKAARVPRSQPSRFSDGKPHDITARAVWPRNRRRVERRAECPPPPTCPAPSSPFALPAPGMWAGRRGGLRLGLRLLQNHESGHSASPALGGMPGLRVWRVGSMAGVPGSAQPTAGGCCICHLGGAISQGLVGAVCRRHAPASQLEAALAAPLAWPCRGHPCARAPWSGCSSGCQGSGSFDSYLEPVCVSPAKV